MISALTEIGLVVTVLLGGGSAAVETTPWLEVIRDGSQAQRQEIQEVVAEGTRTFSLGTHSQDQENSFREQYRFLWYQSGDRLRYEHEIAHSNRDGYDTADSWHRVGRDIHIVLADAHILHYESDGTTLIFDREDWFRRKEGLLRYLAVDGSSDITSYATRLLTDEGEESYSPRVNWDMQVSRHDEGDGTKIEVSRGYRSEQGETWRSIWVDPLRGFYPVRYDARAIGQIQGTGGVSNIVHCEVELTPVGSDNWYPARCSRVDLRKDGVISQESVDVWEFTDLEVNQGQLMGRGEQFSIHSLGLQEGSVVIDQRASKGYLTGQTIFTYGRFGISDFDLRGYLVELERATAEGLAIDQAAHVGNAELFRWDDQAMLYLSREPLCSVFALWTILAHEGHPQQLDTVFNWFAEVSPHGVSANQLVVAAASAGLPCQVVQIKPKDLRKVLRCSKRPVVLHMDRQHFVAAVEARSDGILIADFPEVKLLDWENLEKSWTGTILLFDRQALAHNSWGRPFFASSAIVCGVIAVFLPIYRWRRNSRER